MYQYDPIVEDENAKLYIAEGKVRAEAGYDPWYCDPHVNVPLESEDIRTANAAYWRGFDQGYAVAKHAFGPKHD